jgi:hypothetical protein
MGIDSDKNHIYPKIFLDKTHSNKNTETNPAPEEKTKGQVDKAQTFPQFMLPAMDLSQIEKSRNTLADSRTNIREKVNIEWEGLGKKDLG